MIKFRFKFKREFYVLVFLLSIGVSAQTTKVDSLERSLKLSVSDSAKSRIYGQLFEHLIFTDHEKALTILGRLKSLSNSTLHPYPKYTYYSNEAFNYFITSKGDSALISLERALLAEHIANPIVELNDLDDANGAGHSTIDRVPDSLWNSGLNAMCLSRTNRE